MGLLNIIQNTKNIDFTIIISFLAVLHSSNGFLFEIAKLLPNPEFQFTPGMMYETEGGVRVKPTTVNVIKANGYPVETHQVHTEDGYILEMHRIPHGIPSGSDPNKFPIILHHGFGQSSIDFVFNTPANMSLGFLLADNGYDVWIGNHRGTMYSYRHESYSYSSSRYWDFSCRELGYYDTTAMIDYVRGITQKQKVHYAGFSQGTIAFFVAMSLRPEYNSKIGLGVMMGPSAFQTHYFAGVPRSFPFLSRYIEIFQSIFGSFPLLSHFLSSFLNLVLPLICNPKLDVLGVCINVFSSVFGNDGGIITKSQLAMITSVMPSPGGYKPINHQLQLVKSSRFAEYDHGRRKNLEIYGTVSPPDYNITNIKAPVALIVGANDFLAHREDAKTIAKDLPNLIEFYLTPYKQFTHLDFTYGRDKAVEVYKHVLDLLEGYNDVR